MTKAQASTSKMTFEPVDRTDSETRAPLPPRASHAEANTFSQVPLSRGVSTSMGLSLKLKMQIVRPPSQARLIRMALSFSKDRISIAFLPGTDKDGISFLSR